MSEYKQYILRISYGTTSYDREVMAIDDKSAIERVEHGAAADPFFTVASNVTLFGDKEPIAEWDYAPSLNRKG